MSQANAYFAHLAKPVTKLSSRSTRSDAMRYKKETFCSGDIVEASDGGERAAVVRVVYKPYASSRDRARELLLLVELTADGGMDFNREDPILFPGSWANWDRVPADRKGSKNCSYDPKAKQLHLHMDALIALEQVMCLVCFVAPMCCTDVSHVLLCRHTSKCPKR